MPLHTAIELVLLYIVKELVMKCSNVRIMVIAILLILGAAPLVGNAFAQQAFPGAAGYGSNTPGGRGGRVIAVTNLNDSGPGSFRNAVEASGPRIVIFRTGGTIRTNRNIIIRNPYITIAGQTAPGGGICLAGAGIYIITHDVILRGMFIRVGDDPAGHNPENRDGISLDATLGDVRNIIIDQCSISWAVDETVSFYGSRARNLTISNSIIAEGLDRSIHPKGPHSKGLQIGPGVTNVTVYNNLHAHNVERNPRIQGTNVEFINNVVYNRQKWDLDIGGASNSHQVVVIGNHFKRGPNYSQNPYPISLRSTTAAGTRVYSHDNIGEGYAAGNLCDRSQFLVTTRPFGPTGVRIRSARDAYNWVLANAGANPKNPDPVDARVIANARAGNGRIIDRISQVGGFPNLARGTAPVDSDGDGMPDSWEIARGLNPNNPADANGDRNGDGFTNIEEYINSFYEAGAGPAPANPMNAPTLRIISTP
jgi:pectate lyase